MKIRVCEGAEGSFLFFFLHFIFCILARAHICFKSGMFSQVLPKDSKLREDIHPPHPTRESSLRLPSPQKITHAHTRTHAHAHTHRRLFTFYIDGTLQPTDIEQADMEDEDTFSFGLRFAIGFFCLYALFWCLWLQYNLDAFLFILYSKDKSKLFSF